MSALQKLHKPTSTRTAYPQAGGKKKKASFGLSATSLRLMSCTCHLLFAGFFSFFHKNKTGTRILSIKTTRKINVKKASITNPQISEATCGYKIQQMTARVWKVNSFGCNWREKICALARHLLISKHLSAKVHCECLEMDYAFIKSVWLICSDMKIDS